MKYKLRHRLYPEPQIETKEHGAAHFSGYVFETDDAGMARVLAKDPEIVLEEGRPPKAKAAPSASGE